MSDNDTDVKQNDTTGYVIYVPNSAADTTVRDYLRLGDPDSTYELDLIDPTDGGTDKTLKTQKGALIYSTESVTLSGPTVTQFAKYVADWSSDNLSVVGTGSDFQSATWKGSSAGATTTFQRVANLTTTLGSTTNLLTGNSMTQWLGNAASTGTGSLLWSNYGFTQNVFGGQIVNIINNTIDVQGIGETKIVPEYSVVAPTSITLSVSPASAISTYAKVIGGFAAFSGIASALVQDGLDAASVIDPEIEGSRDTGLDSMRDAMARVTDEIITASALIAVMQAMAIAAGAAAAISAKLNSSIAPSRIKITEDGVTIRGAMAATMDIGASGINIFADSFNFNGTQVNLDAIMVKNL
ncbi:hypothetical protein [Inquilinus sp. CA228]|uniref:hypothetical protein n=1 Tax=Inquilinus sp. CA228 TaxID=3455609 RepID=UPI003F8D6CD1